MDCRIHSLDCMNITLVIIGFRKHLISRFVSATARSDRFPARGVGARYRCLCRISCADAKLGVRRISRCVCVCKVGAGAQCPPCFYTTGYQHCDKTFLQKTTYSSQNALFFYCYQYLYVAKFRYVLIYYKLLSLFLSAWLFIRKIISLQHGPDNSCKKVY